MINAPATTGELHRLLIESPSTPQGGRNGAVFARYQEARRTLAGWLYGSVAFAGTGNVDAAGNPDPQKDARLAVERWTRPLPAETTSDLMIFLSYLNGDSTENAEPSTSPSSSRPTLPVVVADNLQGFGRRADDVIKSGSL